MAVESSAKFDTKVSYVESNDAKCPMCVRDHPLYACSDFKRLPPGKRLDLAKGKHLCFSCLKPVRHSSRFCKVDMVCSIDGCTYKHSRFLHAGFLEEKSAQAPRQDNAGAAGNTDDAENANPGAVCFVSAHSATSSNA